MDQKTFNILASKDRLLNCYRTALTNQVKENLTLKQRIKKLERELAERTLTHAHV